jgi:hypothetical protein
MSPFFLTLHCKWLPTHIRAWPRPKKQQHFERQLMNAVGFVGLKDDGELCFVLFAFNYRSKACSTGNKCSSSWLSSSGFHLALRGGT